MPLSVRSAPSLESFRRQLKMVPFSPGILLTVSLLVLLVLSWTTVLMYIIFF